MVMRQGFLLHDVPTRPHFVPKPAARLAQRLGKPPGSPGAGSIGWLYGESQFRTQSLDLGSDSILGLNQSARIGLSFYVTQLYVARQRTK
jgi:hypothetical protein